jgi:hypothetical protein
MLHRHDLPLVIELHDRYPKILKVMLTEPDLNTDGDVVGFVGAVSDK